MITLVLGGGWTGRRLCLRDRARFVTTSRTQEKLVELTALGISAVQFDLMDDKTWNNLPNKADVEATIFTFEILSTQLPAFERLWKNHIASNRPVVCFGTSSCFQGDCDHESVINETLPLTGLGVSGASLEDRVKGEEWMLKNGATILHLSGIVGDEESDKKIGHITPRTIRSFISKGYVRNGLSLINAIHINDIYKIVLILIERLKVEHQQNTQSQESQDTNKDSVGIHASGERILASCGAFRVKDWVEMLKYDPLPEIRPPDVSMQRSKIISIAKLSAFLPADYKWTLPLEGVEPVSRGLPTVGPIPVTGVDGVTHDRQWESMKSHFRGNWHGQAVWYTKDKGDEKGFKMDHRAFIANIKKPVLDLVIERYQYRIHVYFLDADTGVWDCTGVRFAPNGKKTTTFSRKTYESGKMFCFEGMCGRCSLNTEGGVFAELNFFYKRSRSMIIVLYKLDTTTCKFLLDSIGIAPFRCALGCDFLIKPPQAEVRGNLNTLLKSLEEKTCLREWMNSKLVLTCDGKVCEYPTKAVLSFSDPNRVVQLFDDDLVCSIPSEVQAGSGCELVLGCFHTTDFAQIITLTYDPSGKIESFVLEKWQ